MACMPVTCLPPSLAEFLNLKEMILKDEPLGTQLVHKGKALRIEFSFYIKAITREQETFLMSQHVHNFL